MMAVKKKNRDRRPKGSGTLQWIGNQVRGRKRIKGLDVYTTLYSDPEDAEKALKKLGVTDQKPSKMPSFGDYLLELILPHDSELAEADRRPDLDHAWRGRYVNEYAQNTWELHESRYRLYIAKSKLSKIQINLVRRRDIKDFIWARKAEMKPHSLRRLGSVIHTAFENAVTLDELIETNPAHKIPYPAVDESPAYILSDKQVHGIYDSAAALKWPRNAKQFARMLVVSVDSGVRPGEVCAIPKTAFNRDAGTITLGVSAKRRKGGIEIEGTKTNKVRVVDLSADALAAIETELKDNPNPGSFVFARKNGKPFRPDTYSHQFLRFRRENKIGGAKLKDLRKTAVTLLVEEGDLKSAQKIAGHSKSQITADVYQQARRERQSAAIASVEKRIGRRFPHPENGEKLA